MNGLHIFVAGCTDAMDYAALKLAESGCMVSRTPSDETNCVLLDVPLRTDPAPILARLPADVTVVGGKLPELGYKTIDLLQDPMYLAENANITAHCAVKLAMNRLPVILQDQPVMIIGWGRIGKCLASLLKRLGAQVWVYARKETDRAMLQALGYGIGELTDTDRYRVIFNTVPTLLLPQIHSRCLKIDLASTPGIAGEDVIHARGLPGKEAAQSSGELIARRLLHLMKGDLL